MPKKWNTSREYYHNKGQEDAQKGKYEPPHGIVDDLTTWSKSGIRENSEENQAYREGYANQKGQSDGAKNEYNNPFSYSSNKDAHKAYKESWRSSYDNKEKESGGCFVSSACIISRNLPDNCSELSTLRAFRDDHLLTSSSGCKLVEEYYDIAQGIVKKINSRRNSDLIWEKVFVELIKPTCKLIDMGQFDEAVKLYRLEVLKLKQLYS